MAFTLRLDPELQDDLDLTVAVLGERSREAFVRDAIRDTITRLAEDPAFQEKLGNHAACCAASVRRLAR